MSDTKYTVSKIDSQRIQAVRTLRDELWRYFPPRIAISFSVELRHAWADKGIEGIRATCWALAQELEGYHLTQFQAHVQAEAEKIASIEFEG